MSDETETTETEILPATISADPEPKPFKWRLTMQSDGTLGVEVGDDFELAEQLYGHGETATIQQIGLGAAQVGLQLFGVPKESRHNLLRMAIQLQGDVTFDDVEDDEDG